MKVRLNVLDRKLEVVSMNFYNDGVQSVTVIDGNGNYLTYFDTAATIYTEQALKINMKDSLEYPDIKAEIEDGNNKLIEHLSKFYEDESDYLTNIAIEAMEKEQGLPFDNHLSDKQKEYKLRQQRVFGVIDTIEEVRAFQEGWFNREEQELEAK